MQLEDVPVLLKKTLVAGSAFIYGLASLFFAVVYVGQGYAVLRRSLQILIPVVS